MSHAQVTQGVVDRYTLLGEKIAAYEVKERAGTLTPSEAAFLQSFRRQQGELATEVVLAKMSSNAWPASKIIERMA